MWKLEKRLATALEAPVPKPRLHEASECTGCEWIEIWYSSTYLLWSAVNRYAIVNGAARVPSIRPPFIKDMVVGSLVLWSLWWVVKEVQMNGRFLRRQSSCRKADVVLKVRMQMADVFRFARSVGIWCGSSVRLRLWLYHDEGCTTGVTLE